MATILIVEDNELNRDMLSRRLIKKGYQIEFAEDGKEGLEENRASETGSRAYGYRPTSDGRLGGYKKSKGKSRNKRCAHHRFDSPCSRARQRKGV